MPLVFETTGGEDLAQLRVPSFFTYAGFHRAFLDRLGTIEQQMAREQWVLGEAGKQTAVTTQYATLTRDVIALYSREFIVGVERRPEQAAAQADDSRQAHLHGAQRGGRGDHADPQPARHRSATRRR